MKLRYSEAFYSVQGEGFCWCSSYFYVHLAVIPCMNFGLDRSEPMRDEKQKMVLLEPKKYKI